MVLKTEEHAWLEVLRMVSRRGKRYGTPILGRSTYICHAIDSMLAADMISGRMRDDMRRRMRKHAPGTKSLEGGWWAPGSPARPAFAETMAHLCRDEAAKSNHDDPRRLTFMGMHEYATRDEASLEFVDSTRCDSTGRGLVKELCEAVRDHCRRHPDGALARVVRAVTPFGGGGA